MGLAYVLKNGYLVSFVGSYAFRSHDPEIDTFPSVVTTLSFLLFFREVHRLELIVECQAGLEHSRGCFSDFCVFPSMSAKEKSKIFLLTQSFLLYFFLAG